MTIAIPTLRTGLRCLADLHRALRDLPLSAAVLDELGTIRAVNRAWKAFAAAHGGLPERTGIAVDYLMVCDHAASDLDADAALFGAGLRQVLHGQLATFSHAGRAAGGFASRVVRCEGRGGPAIVVTHEPVARIETAAA